MRRARLEIIKGQIFEVFNHRDDKIYSVADLSSLYQEHAGIWRLPASTSLNKFIQFLILKGPLTRYQLKFRYQPTTLFCWGPLNLI